jgi:hypothetical protein
MKYVIYGDFFRPSEEELHGNELTVTAVIYRIVHVITMLISAALFFRFVNLLWLKAYIAPRLYLIEFIRDNLP